MICRAFAPRRFSSFGADPDRLDSSGLFADKKKNESESMCVSLFSMRADADFGRGGERLQNHAIPLGETNQRIQLFLCRCCVELETKSDLFESNRDFL